MLKVYQCLMFLFLALGLFSCSKSCEDCSDDYSLRFKFTDASDQQVLKDVSQLELIDLNSNSLAVQKVETESDSLYLATLNAPTSGQSNSDTIIFIYNNTVIDSARVSYGFQRDNDCCTNPRIVESIQLLNLEASRLIRREFNVYSIIVE